MPTLSPERRDEVRSVAQTSRTRGVLLLRSLTGCSLREAVDTLQEIVPIAGPLSLHPTVEVLAFGPFSAAVAEHLDYPAEYFAAVAPGTPISVQVCEAHGPESVAHLARSLGIDASDMNQWSVTAEHIDGQALEEAGLCDAADVEALRSAGFSFHFVPQATLTGASGCLSPAPTRTVGG
jgi:hypothetical protein